MFPVVRSKENFLLCPCYTVGHVSADICQWSNDCQRHDTTATKQWWRHHAAHRILFYRPKHIVVDLCLLVYPERWGQNSLTWRNSSLGGMVPHLPHSAAILRHSGVGGVLSTRLCSETPCSNLPYNFLRTSPGVCDGFLASSELTLSFAWHSS